MWLKKYKQFYPSKLHEKKKDGERELLGKHDSKNHLFEVDSDTMKSLNLLSKISRL